MTTPLTVPTSIENIVQRYNEQTTPFDEFAIGGELKAARGALTKPSNAETLGAWAEVLAFGLAAGQHENPWNSYFGPIGSATDETGKNFYFPDITGTPPEVV